MTDEERMYLIIEKKAYAEVVRQFTIHTCDARMECGLNEFLSTIEDKIREIDNKLNGLQTNLVKVQV